MSAIPHFCMSDSISSDYFGFEYASNIAAKDVDLTWNHCNVCIHEMLQKHTSDVVCTLNKTIRERGCCPSSFR